VVAEPLEKLVAATARAPRQAAVEAWLARSGSPLAARVRTARELAAATTPPEPAPWSAALPELAPLFPAGLPRGELVELTGRGAAGRFALALALLAAATGAGESGALVDLGDGLDPQQAASAGVELARLLWARPRETREALAAAEALVDGGFPLVVVDLGLPPVAGGRGAEASWIRLARGARAACALVLVSAPYPVCGVAPGAALRLERPRVRWSGIGAEPRLLAGGESRLRPRFSDRAAVPAGVLRRAVS
jgi:hypothetical protein